MNSDWMLALMLNDGLGNLTLRLVPKFTAEAFDVLVQRYQDEPFSKESPFVKAYSRRTQVWSIVQVKLYLDRFKAYLATDPEATKPELIFKSTFKLCARYCPLAEAIATLQCFDNLIQNYPAWKPHVQEAHALLEFRVAMHASFTEAP